MGIWSSTYSEVAMRLGLTLHGDHVFSPMYELAGERLGHQVRVCRDTVMMKDLTIQVRLRYPLDLGLTLAPKTLVGRVGHSIAELFGAKPFMRSGDAELDGAFAFHADEEPRVAELVKAARDTLTGWARFGGDFQVDDLQARRHRLVYTMFDDDADSICAEIDGLVRLATGIEEARAKIPAARALAHHVPGFRALSERYKLDLMTTPLATWGTIGSHGYWGRTIRHAPGSFTLESAVYAPSSMKLGGVVQTAKREVARGAGTGDTMFDERFAISSHEVIPALTSEVRNMLVRFADAGEEVMLSDRGLCLIASLWSEPYPLERHAEEAVALVRAAVAALEPRPAYR